MKTSPTSLRYIGTSASLPTYDLIESGNVYFIVGGVHTIFLEDQSTTNFVMEIKEMINMVIVNDNDTTLDQK